MKLVLLNNNIFADSEDFSLKGKRVRVLNGSFSISKKEKERIISFAKKTWKQIWRSTDLDHFVGHVRFDLIPRLNEKKEKEKGNFFDLGELFVDGIYEVNVHTPECAPAVAAQHNAFPKLREIQPSATKRLAERIKESFSAEKIYLAWGSGAVKEEWGSYYLKEMNEIIEVIPLENEEIKRLKPSPLYRWGDVRFGEFSEFSSDFQKWLLKAQNNSVLVFNTIPEEPTQDVGSKRFVFNSETDYLLDSESDMNYFKELNKDEYVLKPLRGHGGEGIFFGRKLKEKEWIKKLKMATSKGGYGLSKAQWLPKIKVKDNFYAFDLNPAFWVQNGEIEYLYTIARIESYESYWQRGMINVSQGAGFAGTIQENN